MFTFIETKLFTKLVQEYLADDEYARLQQAIAEDWWAQRIGTIKQMKERILNELGFFPLMAKLLN